MREDAKCRECVKWRPGRGLVGTCAVEVPPGAPLVGEGWERAPSWFGCRRCNCFELSTGWTAAEQTDAVAAQLLIEPLAHRRTMLARMEAEDSALVSCIKQRMIDLHREARA